MIAVSGENNLSVRFPKLVLEWGKGNNILPSDVHWASSRKVWWVCGKGHEWQQHVSTRTKKGADCPYCSGRFVCKDNNLSAANPELASEWDDERNDYGAEEVRPKSVEYGWWKCSKGHSWKASIYSRAYGGTSCPICMMGRKVSDSELRILSEVNAVFPDAIGQHKIDRYECDVFIPQLGIIVEYDGSRWHRGKENRDRKKTEALTKKGFIVIRLRGEPLRKVTDNDVLFSEKENLFSVCKALMVTIERVCRVDLSGYRHSTDFLGEERYQKFIKQRIPKGQLLSTTSRCGDWDLEKNGVLIPDNFSKGSNKKVWWVCGEGHSYEQSVKDHVKGRDCPYCAGKRVCFSNSVQKHRVSSEWDYGKNSKGPDEFTTGSNKKAWWKCEKGHVWNAVIANRTLKSSGCPYCSRRRKNRETIEFEKLENAEMI